MMFLGLIQCQGDPSSPELQVHTAQEAAEAPAPAEDDPPYRHENGTAIDNLNLNLQECVNIGGGLCIWQTLNLSRSVSPTEEKERVFLSGALGGRKFRLAVTGADVTSYNEAGCSGNAMRFHLAWLYEDSARDDANDPNDLIGPSANINPEQ